MVEIEAKKSKEQQTEARRIKEELDAWARFLYKVYKRKRQDGSLKSRQKVVE